MNYQDINLVPRVISSIESRSEIDTSNTLGDLTLKSPFIAAPMVDVVDKKVMEEMEAAGGTAIYHRFDSPYSIEYLKISNPNRIFAVGLSDSHRVYCLYQAGVRHFCLDVANGANLSVVDALRTYSNFKDIKFIVGNFASYDQINELYDILTRHNLHNMVCGVRLGVAPGKSCRTQNATGILATPISILLTERRKFSPSWKLIADGGIKEPGDACKALALGADFVMMGATIAACKDSPAREILQNGQQCKIYRGSASSEIQELYRSTVRYIEGTTSYLPKQDETVQELINRYTQGLQSSMSYFNSRNIEEFHTLSNWQRA